MLESTTYPGTTRERVAPLLEASGLKAGEGFHLAFSPERVDPGREDWTTKTTPKVVGGLTEECTRRAVELYASAVRRGDRGLLARGRRADEAAREHLPLGQHRARQRARAALRPDGARHLGDRRRGGDQAVRLHALRARPGPRRPLPTGRPVLPLVEGAPVRLLHRVHRARGQGQPEHAVLLPLADLAGAEPRRAALAERLEGARARRRLQGRRLRHARVAGAEADRAPAQGRRRGRLPRPARARSCAGSGSSRSRSSRAPTTASRS